MNLNELDYRVAFYSVSNNGPEAGVSDKKEILVVSLVYTNPHKKMYN